MVVHTSACPVTDGRVQALPRILGTRDSNQNGSACWPARSEMRTGVRILRQTKHQSADTIAGSMCWYVDVPFTRRLAGPRRRQVLKAIRLSGARPWHHGLHCLLRSCSSLLHVITQAELPARLYNFGLTSLHVRTAFSSVLF